MAQKRPRVGATEPKFGPKLACSIQNTNFIRKFKIETHIIFMFYGELPFLLFPKNNPNLVKTAFLWSKLVWDELPKS